MMKRISAMLLCLMMCLSLIPAAAFAEGTISLAEPAGESSTDVISGTIVSAAQGNESVKDEAAATFVDDPAGGNAQSTSGPLTLGGHYQLFVPKGGYLYYYFTAPVGDVYYFVSGCTDDTDPVGYIYSSSWAVLEKADDTSGLGRNFKIGHYLKAGETFYVCLGLYDQSKSGMVPAWIEKENTGWVREGDDWYYFDEDSSPVSGAYYINGTTYGFYEDGRMAVNDAVYDQDDDVWRFADAKGIVQSEPGWYKGFDGNWYYVVSGGRLLCGEWLKDKGVWYYFHEGDSKEARPVMAHDGAYKYRYGEAYEFYFVYFKASGAWDNTPGWKKDSAGSWYYVKSDGHCALSEWQKIGKTWYYFDGWAKMVTGWYQIGGDWENPGQWYYFESSGAMKTGWLKSGGSWYYLGSSGAMATGWQKIGGVWYYFREDGVMVTGWAKIGGSWYYFTSSGAMKTGWLKDGGKWYYLDSSGAMLANTSRIIGGKTYYFNGSGVCINP